MKLLHLRNRTFPHGQLGERVIFGLNENIVLAFVLISVGIIFLLIGAVGSYLWFNRKPVATATPKADPVPQSVHNLRNFYDLTTSLINTINYERVLEIALDMSIAAFDTDGTSQKRVVSSILLFAGDSLVIHSSRGLSPADTRVTFHGIQGGLGQVIQIGEPHLISDPKSDAELNRVVAFAMCSSIYLIPLRSSLDIYGVLAFGHQDAKFFDTESKEILDIIAAQAINAMQNAQLYNELEQEKERMVDAQEEARRKLARDLHDGPTQSISAIAMRVNFARRLMATDLKSAEKELHIIEEMARDTTQEIRHMLFTLRPLVLESQGLVPALEAMAEKVNDTYQQNVIIDVDLNTVEVLDIAKRGLIFYIVEESIANARKHAKADHIWVRLKSLSPDIGLLEIEDDGIGFDVQSVNLNYDSRGSLGMFTLRERTELIRGIFQLESNINQGTKIQIFIPFSQAGIDQLRQAQQ